MAGNISKAKIDFPNRWALDSFILKLRKSPGMEVYAHSDTTNFKLRQNGSADAILIGLNKPSSAPGAVTMLINAEKFPKKLEDFWKEIHSIAIRYQS